MLGPRGQTRQLHRDAADNQHRQKNALPERLHRRHVIRQHRQHETQADERKRHHGERDPKIQRMRRQRHTQTQSEPELQRPGAQNNHVARERRAHHERPRRQRRESVPPPHATFALAHQRRRQTKARAAEHAHRQQLAHVADQRNLFVPIQHPKRHEENQRKQITVQQRHPISKMQPQRLPEMFA